MQICSFLPAAIAALAIAAPAFAVDSPDWTARKCALYGAAYADALTALGTDGLSAEFLTANDAFLASDCQDVPSYCATGAAEARLIDMLTVMTMNEGMASTFVPYTCQGD